MLKCKSLFFMSFSFLCLVQFGVITSAQAQVKPLMGHIAVSADGNFGDRDDIAATPLALAILEKAGFKSKLVHYGYNAKVWESIPSQKKDMTDSVTGAISRFGYKSGIFYSVIDNKNKAYNALKDQINNSSVTDPLYILAAAPYEHICQSIKLANKNKWQYVTVINHGDSNPVYQRFGSCVAKDVAKMVKYVDIANQNGGFKGSYADWQWLKNSKDDNLQWLYKRMIVANPDKADVSDAGLMWYMVTGGPKNGGKQHGTPSDLKAFFTSSSDTVNKTCSASAMTRQDAKSNFESKCSVTFNPDLHDCKQTSAVNYVCGFR